ncbi:MAG TPA: hypothetical protein VNU19_07055 [Candidatus Acidoferrum sp.]|nr:hypothetical protein [Candidatus Acidoferrum sp.]
MSTTNHYIGVVDPSNSAFVNVASTSTANVTDGTSSNASALVEVRWVSNTTITSGVNRKQFKQALDLIYRHVVKGGFNNQGTGDLNVPV